MAGLVDDATIARMLDEPPRPFSWRPGADPTVAELVGDRFGEQVVTRSVDPLLAGVYAGSAATIGLRSAAPTLAAALDRGAPQSDRRGPRGAAAAGAGSVFGAVDGGYAVLLDELVRRAGFRWAQVAVERRASVGSAGGSWSTTRARAGMPTRWCWRSRHRGWPSWSPTSRRAARRRPADPGGVDGTGGAGAARRHAAAGAVGVLVAGARTVARQGDHAVVAQVGRRGNVELVRLSFGRFGDDMARSVGDDELLSWAAAGPGDVFGITAEPVDCRVHRWIDAMPQYGPGHGDLVAELRAGPAADAGGGGRLPGRHRGARLRGAAATRAAASTGRRARVAR